MKPNLSLLETVVAVQLSPKNKVSYFSFVLDLFFPRQNINFSDISSYLTDAEIVGLNYKYKVLEKEQAKYIEKVLVCSDFSNSLIKDLIDRSKFFGETAISKDFARLILYKLKTEQLSPDLFIPVPTDPKRFLERGYHLPHSICYELEKILDTPTVDLLFKTENTLQQSLLDKQKRLVNLKGKFKLNQNLAVNLANYTNIFLVDDLSTTGTTLVECAKVLKQNFPFVKIYGVAVAGN